MGLVLGVDGGGSKTLAVLADQSGRVLGVGLGGPSNFQVAGVAAARWEVKKSIKEALAQAQLGPKRVQAAYFGMAGADRPRDYEIVAGLLKRILPEKVLWSFDNDALLGLWAGTLDGVGVSVVCGTGTNVVGVNREGKRVQIGGMGRLFGDYAGGGHIGELALARAVRGWEGRGRPTLLYDRLCQHYQVNELLDLVDFIYAGKSLELSTLVPLVIAAAAQGDGVAREILQEVGREMGVSAYAALRRLFSKKESVQVVGVGGVFLRAELPLMFEEFTRTLKETEYRVQPTILKAEPVVGAIFGAAAQLKWEITPGFKERLSASLQSKLVDLKNNSS